MMVLILERVSAPLRGELTRWLLEPKSGVFVGRVSGMVRDRLWEKACKQVGGGGCLLFYTANTEQGFQIRTWGQTSRRTQDYDGLVLVKWPL